MGHGDHRLAHSAQRHLHCLPLVPGQTRGRSGLDLLPSLPLALQTHHSQLAQLRLEWKEHIAWFAPILATAVAFVVTYYGQQLAHESKARRTVLWLFVLAFVAAGVAGLFGAFINKVAPIR